MRQIIHCRGKRSEIGGMKRQKGEIAVDTETSGADRFFHYPDCGDGFLGVHSR